MSDFFDAPFERAQRDRKRAARRARAWLTILVVLLVLSSTALGWGWGYNTRVSQECGSRGGSWDTVLQVCHGESGEIPL